MNKIETISEIKGVKAKNGKKDMSWGSFFTLLFLIVVFRIYVLEPHNVSGSSMDNTFKDGDYVLVDKLTYRFQNPKAGDVIVFNPPAAIENKNRFIKRVIATPGQSIEIKENNTYIDGKLIPENFVSYRSNKTSTSTLLADNQYFVMGDNRYVSYDSRYWGPITKDEIQGRVLVRLYPFDKIGFFPGKSEYIENK